MTSSARLVLSLVWLSLVWFSLAPLGCGGRASDPDAATALDDAGASPDAGTSADARTSFDDAAGDDAATPRDGASACTPVAAREQLAVPYVVRGDPASDAMTLLDVYPPEAPGCLRPIVVWVHGGAWSVGDRTNRIADKIPLFHGLGAVFVSIDYRLTSATNGVQHPDHVVDVAAAFAWVREHALELGGDPERIILLGHSAGAHLVALVATNPRFLAMHGLAPRDVACVGSYDSEYTASEIVMRDAAYEAVFGTDPAGWEDASPSAHVGPDIPPFQLACRGSGPRVAQCEDFAAALRDAGNEASSIDASALTHEEVNERIGAAGDTVMTPFVVDFVTRCATP